MRGTCNASGGKTILLISGFRYLIPVFLVLVSAVSAFEGSDDPIEIKEIKVTYNKPLSALKVECLLHIPHSWHVNSDSSGLEYLIATGVKLADSSTGVRTKKEYPKADTLVLFGQKIDVFSGNLSFKNYFYLNPGTKFPLEAVVQYQACNDKMCLPPRYHKFVIKKTGEKEYTATLIKKK